MKRKPLYFVIVLSLLLNIAMTGNVYAEQHIKKSDSNVPTKSVGKNGEIPSAWNIAKPKPQPHPDVPPPVPGNNNYKNLVEMENYGVSGGNGDGRNNISFAHFDSGDIIVGLGTPTGHAGEFDLSRYSGINSYCIWSANVEPVNGVQLEQPVKYHGYDMAYGLWVPSLSYSARVAAKNYCESQKGEPYRLNAYKNTTDEWYCSKLCWGSYRWTAGMDLDADGGLYVWPVDLVNDDQTSVFAYST